MLKNSSILSANATNSRVVYNQALISHHGLLKRVMSTNQVIAPMKPRQVVPSQ